MHFPQRKSIRLPDYSYNQYGSYFLTLCTKDKKNILCKIQETTVFESPAIILSEYGRIVEEQILAFTDFYKDIRIETYVIMPNHIHLLVSITDILQSKSNPSNERIPSLVSTLKRFTNKSAGAELWQRSFHDHVIRNFSDFQIIWKYIEDNPAKWKSDCFYIDDSDGNAHKV